jgi:protein TonB
VAAARRNTQGRVEVSYTINSDGRVSDVQIVSSEPPGVFDRAARDAVEDWRYEATGRSTRTIRSIEFRLE